MPSSPAKVRPLSDYGGPSRSSTAHNPPEQPVAKRAATKAAETVAKQAPKAAAALGPEAVVAAKVAGKVAERKAGKSRSVPKLGGGPRFTGRHLLIGEFLVCFLVLAMSPLAKDVKAGEWMKKATAVCLLFVILALVGSAGPKSRKASGALGALITVGLLLDQRAIFGVLAGKFASPAQQQATGR